MPHAHTTPTRNPGTGSRGMRRRVAAVLASLSVAGVTLVATAPTSSAATPTKFANCTALNKVYKHGAGRSGAKDKTTGKPVTTFKVSTSLYRAIVKYNPRLDRDHDGIACEKR